MVGPLFDQLWYEVIYYAITIATEEGPKGRQYLMYCQLTHI